MGRPVSLDQVRIYDQGRTYDTGSATEPTDRGWPTAVGLSAGSGRGG